MSGKKHKLYKDYLKEGFMDTTVSGQAVRQYMMLFENLSSDAWRPSLVQLHLQTKHTGHQCKSWTFFRSQQDSLKHEYQDYLQ